MENNKDAVLPQRKLFVLPSTFWHPAVGDHASNVTPVQPFVEQPPLTDPASFAIAVALAEQERQMPFAQIVPADKSMPVPPQFAPSKA